MLLRALREQDIWHDAPRLTARIELPRRVTAALQTIKLLYNLIRDQTLKMRQKSIDFGSLLTAQCPPRDARIDGMRNGCRKIALVIFEPNKMFSFLKMQNR